MMVQCKIVDLQSLIFKNNVSLLQYIQICKLLYSVMRLDYIICNASWEWKFTADPFLAVLVSMVTEKSLIGECK